MPIPFIPFENTLCQDNSAHGSFPVRFICSPEDVLTSPMIPLLIKYMQVL